MRLTVGDGLGRRLWRHLPPALVGLLLAATNTARRGAADAGDQRSGRDGRRSRRHRGGEPPPLRHLPGRRRRSVAGRGQRLDAGVGATVAVVGRPQRWQRPAAPARLDRPDDPPRRSRSQRGRCTVRLCALRHRQRHARVARRCQRRDARDQHVHRPAAVGAAGRGRRTGPRSCWRASTAASTPTAPSTACCASVVARARWKQSRCSWTASGCPA